MSYSVNGGASYTFAAGWADGESGPLSIPLPTITNLNQVILKLTVIAISTGSPAWTNLAISNLAASVAGSGGGYLGAQILSASALGFSVPSGAAIIGVGVSFVGSYSGTAPNFSFQLTNGGTPFGTNVGFALTTSPAPGGYGNSAYLWGYSAWTPATFNSLGVNFSAYIPSGSGTVSINQLVLTVYYTLTNVGSDGLNVTGFGFDLPSSDGIIGIQVALKGYAASGATVSAQLLKAGVLVGVAESLTLPATAGTVDFGSATDLLGAPWLYSDVNNTGFGVRFVVTSGAGTVYLDYCSITVYATSTQANFNWVGGFEDDAGNQKNFALDANGELWLEDVTNAPGVLTTLSSITPAGSYAGGCGAFNRQYITPSTLTQGVGLPLQYAPQGWLDKVTQDGPGAPCIVSAAQSAGSTCMISNFSITSNVVTLTTSTQGYVAGEVITISGLSVATYLNGLTFSILGTGLTTTQVEIAFVHANVSSTADAGTITPQYSYPIVAATAGIKQVAAKSDPGDAGYLQCVLWSSGPGSKSPGNVITIYYVNAFTYPAGEDQQLVNAFNSGIPVYVHVASAPWGNGTWLVTSVGMDAPPNAEYGRYYFTFQVPTSNYQQTGAPDSATGTYQITQATLTTTVPVPNLAPGDQVSISGAGVSGWNSVFTITQSLNSGSYNITQTALSGGIATYSWSLINGVAPAPGELVTVSGTLNANGLLNVTDAVVASVTGSSSGTFTVANYPTGLTFATAVEEGQATTAGTIFTFDPGAALAGSNQNPIYGNSGGGTLQVVGASLGSTFPIGAGTRQIVYGFITRNGYFTAPSPPSTFTIPTGSNYVSVSQVAVGPPNVVGRWFAITEAGQNGIAGGNFYTSDVPTVFTVGNTQYTSSALIVQDNVTTQAKFTFSDSVLLSGEAVDIQGNNRFNLLNIGAPAWTLQYGSRMFYGLAQNKVPNFLNLSFDGGYIPSTGAVPNVPLGWSIDQAYNFPFGPALTITAFQITSNIVTLTATNTLSAGQPVAVNGLSTGTYLNGLVFTVVTASSSQFTAAFTHADVGLTADSGTAAAQGPVISLLNSPIFGNSLYLKNTTGVTQSICGYLSQPAYQDVYNVPIILPNTQYSIRVTARCPSGINPGGDVGVTFDLFGAQSGARYGFFDVLLSSAQTYMQTFTGTLLSTPLSTIPEDLQLRIYGFSLPTLTDFEIDRIEVFPTLQPVLPGPLASYVDLPEAVDGVSGPLNTNGQNNQPCYGGAVIYDQLYLLKERTMLTTEDSPNLEPSDWSVHQVSATVGTCGTNAFDYGDEWLLTACRSGIYGFIGKAPTPVSRELQGPTTATNIWENIDWSAGNSVWLRNDLANRRFYVGIPLPTPNFWLPTAPVNAAPTSPNVVLMCNYQGCPTFEEMVSSTPVHTTMFGDLKAVDMRRKWSIWQIPAAYAAFVQQADGLSLSLFFCNGIASGKIYQLDSEQTTDDGAAITPLYTTYGFVGSKQAQMIPGMSSSRNLWTYLSTYVAGSGKMNLKLYPNTLGATYPYTCPLPLTLADPAQNDQERVIEIAGSKIFAEMSMTGSGGYCSQSRLMLVGQKDPWAEFRGVSQ